MHWAEDSDAEFVNLGDFRAQGTIVLLLWNLHGRSLGQNLPDALT